MKKVSIEELQKLALSQYFQLDDQQLIELQNEFNSLMFDLNDLDTLEVDDLLPTDFCCTHSFNELREDEIQNDSNNPDEILKNAKHRYGRFVVVK